LRGCVIIPAYNEEMRIGHIVREIKAKGLDCLVIDDGSSDKTRKISEREGASVISHPINLGKGTSLRDGFRLITDGGYDFIITMDGDGQHHPDEIGNFIKAAEENDAAIILGNRMRDPKDMPLRRRLTNWFMSALISGIARQDIPDSQCGFRLMRAGVLNTIPLTTDKYEIESEVLIEASRAGFKIISIPIKSIYRGQKSRIRPFIDTIRFISFIISKGIRR
jgi:glycosyltransferase involved in cell wall biosynthesis